MTQQDDTSVHTDSHSCGDIKGMNHIKGAEELLRRCSKAMDLTFLGWFLCQEPVGQCVGRPIPLRRHSGSADPVVLWNV